MQEEHRRPRGRRCSHVSVSFETEVRCPAVWYRAEWPPTELASRTPSGQGPGCCSFVWPPESPVRNGEPSVTSQSLPRIVNRGGV